MTGACKYSRTTSVWRLPKRRCGTGFLKSIPPTYRYNPQCQWSAHEKLLSHQCFALSLGFPWFRYCTPWLDAFKVKDCNWILTEHSIRVPHLERTLTQGGSILVVYPNLTLPRLDRQVESHQCHTELPHSAQLFGITLPYHPQPVLHLATYPHSGVNLRRKTKKIQCRTIGVLLWHMICYALDSIWGFSASWRNSRSLAPTDRIGVFRTTSYMSKYLHEIFLMQNLQQRCHQSKDGKKSKRLGSAGLVCDHDA